MEASTRGARPNRLRPIVGGVLLLGAITWTGVTSFRARIDRVDQPQTAAQIAALSLDRPTELSLTGVTLDWTKKLYVTRNGTHETSGGGDSLVVDGSDPSVTFEASSPKELFLAKAEFASAIVRVRNTPLAKHVCALPILGKGSDGRDALHTRLLAPAEGTRGRLWVTSEPIEDAPESLRASKKRDARVTAFGARTEHVGRLLPLDASIGDRESFTNCKRDLGEPLPHDALVLTSETALAESGNAASEIWVAAKDEGAHLWIAFPNGHRAGDSLTGVSERITRSETTLALLTKASRHAGTKAAPSLASISVVTLGTTDEFRNARHMPRVPLGAPLVFALGALVSIGPERIKRAARAIYLTTRRYGGSSRFGFRATT